MHTKEDILEMSRCAGSALLAIGNSVLKHAKSYVDGMLLGPTIYVDSGRLTLFDDPDLHKIASNCGVPKRIFSALGYLYV